MPTIIQHDEINNVDGDVDADDNASHIKTGTVEGQGNGRSSLEIQVESDITRSIIASCPVKVETANSVGKNQHIKEKQNETSIVGFKVRYVSWLK